MGLLKKSVSDMRTLCRHQQRTTHRVRIRCHWSKRDSANSDPEAGPNPLEVRRVKRGHNEADSGTTALTRAVIARRAEDPRVCQRADQLATQLQAAGSNQGVKLSQNESEKSLWNSSRGRTGRQKR